jgi:hypothetical protein
MGLVARDVDTSTGEVCMAYARIWPSPRLRCRSHAECRGDLLSRLWGPVNASAFEIVRAQIGPARMGCNRSSDRMPLSRPDRWRANGCLAVRAPIS